MTAKNIVMAAAGAAGGAVVGVEDVFSTYLYTGNNSLQIINNGIQIGDGQVGTGGSVYMDGVNSRINAPNTDLFNLGNAWCIEAFIYPMYASTGSIHGRWYNPTNNASYIFWFDGSYIRGGAFPNYNSAGGPVELNKWSHVAMTFDGSTKRFFVNGSLVASYNQDNSITSNPGLLPSIGSNSGGGANFPGYISNLRVVSGSAVYTSSFTVPSSALTAISGTVLLCLQGSSPLTDNSGNGLTLTTFSTVTPSTNGPFGKTNVVGSGGLVWIKARGNAGGAIGAAHLLTDTARGASQQLFSNGTDAQTALSAIGSFTSTGFTVSSYGDVNYTTAPFASWTFKKQEKFFDVVTYTGNGVTGRTINHNLKSVPGCVIIKRLDTTSQWLVWHRGIDNFSAIYLNQTYAKGNWLASSSGITDTTMRVDGGAGPMPGNVNFDTNANGGQYVAYLFAHNAGGFGATGTDNVISCGSYTGTGAGTPPSITLGWEPQWILIKSATNGFQNWNIFDNMRGLPVGGQDALLLANSSASEVTNTDYISVNATGFQVVQGNGNATNESGATYIYIAIRRGPMKAPTSGTSVFNVQAYTGNNASNRIITTNFPIDANLTSSRNSTANPCLGARLFDGMFETYDTGIPYVALTDWIDYDNNTGYKLPTAYQYSNSSSYNYVSASFRRAPNFHDVVCYSGTGSATTINHNLGVAPELIIVKRRNQAGWNGAVYAAGSSGTLLLDQTSAAQTSGYYAGCFTSTSATTFGLNTIGEVNGSGGTYVAWLWASCPGVSKVGSYTGTGATQTIACGFAARFVLIKRTDGTGNWWVWDTARGMVSGTDPRIQLNTTTAEQNADWVLTNASGFQIVTADATINASGGTYIFLAIA